MRYGDFLAAARSVRDALSRAALAANEPVHVRIANQPLDLAAYAGVWLAGGVVVPVHRASPPGAVAHVAAKTRARFEWDGVLNVISSAAPAPRPILEDAALIVFTSGSSGMPKGAVLSHRGFIGKLEAIQSMLGFRETDRTMLVLNITFSFGIWVAVLTLLHGGCVLAREKFAAGAFLGDLKESGATQVAVVPTMMRSLILDVPQSALRCGAPALRQVPGQQHGRVDEQVETRHVVARQARQRRLAEFHVGTAEHHPLVDAAAVAGQALRQSGGHGRGGIRDGHRVAPLVPGETGVQAGAS